MTTIEREKALLDLRKELMVEKSASASGGQLDNPAKIKNLRRSIARMLTIIKQLDLQ